MTAPLKAQLQLLLIAAFAVAFVLPRQAAFAESPKAAEVQGASLFRDKGCAYCHGANSEGTPRGPSLASIRKSWKADRIASQIKDGGQKMPSFGDSLSSTEIDELVSYLRAKHRPAPEPLPPPAAPSQQQP